jgi:tetratricopeptide (TPR) repeat protein
LNKADTLARCAKITLTQLKFTDAAKLFAQAAAALPPGEHHDRARLVYLDQQASALFSQADRFGDNAAATSAIELYRNLLKFRLREQVPLEWAETQASLGDVLRILGERERGSERLEQAVEAYRAALTEQTRERVPLRWAWTQNNLGLALWRLGERGSGTARLEQAVEA